MLPLCHHGPHECALTEQVDKTDIRTLTYVEPVFSHCKQNMSDKALLLKQNVDFIQCYHAEFQVVYLHASSFICKMFVMGF